MRLRPGIAALIAVVAVALAAAGCASDDRPEAAPRPAWHQVSLPTPPGPPGRLAVRDATTCAGQWYVVGAVIGHDGESRPAAWTSSDARTWSPVAVAGRDYYARRAILRSVGCRDGRIAAVGSRSGGAHGNPRTSSWYQRADGTLVDMRATWILYGGADAVSVNRVAAGPDGWLITGNRRSGAAVWNSADATDFRIVDTDPALSSDARASTGALDQVHDGTAWTVVGRAEVDGRVSPEPLAWTSADGLRWVRQEVPAGTRGFAELERVVRDGDDLLAAGVRDRRFGTWRRADGHWRTSTTFGALARDAGQPAFVSGLVADAGRALATVSDGVRYRLWARAGDRWQQLAAPDRPQSTGDTAMTLAADGSQVLLVSDDGTSGRAWVAPWNTLSR